jgi:Zinc carboxypeptidase
MIQKTTLIFTILLLSLTASLAQTIPSPKEHFGFNIGDNYKLANYTQTEEYFKKIAAASDRVKLVNIGNTEEGRTQYMLIVSSPANIKNLNRYKEISMKLARAEGITDNEAQALATEGKAVVWIDGGLHATETVGTHQLIETLYRFVSGNDPETLRILDEVIILFVHANPDGQQLVSDWYMSNPDTLKRSYSQLPRLYQKYVGHDNNRDFFMMNMKETRNMSRQLYIEWMPQVLYNHHQSGPAGSVVAGPPYRDPFNYLINPLTITSIDAVGAAMINRLNVEGKPGYTERGGATFSTWYNGGLRTTSYFHNIVGLLTEIIGNPTPMTVPLVPSRLLPSGSTPYPVKPQKWLFRQSIEYSVSLNYAVLDYAARNREHLLYNIYKMGMNSIEAGNKDYWTLTPKRIDAITNAYKKDQADRKSNDSTNRAARVRGEDIPLKYYDIVFKDSSLRDPRGYIIPANQPDFPTAVTFINALIQSGIKVEKATADFSVEGKKYPSGSYIVQTNQAFRPHVIDMFDPQDHPNDFQYPGGPPIRPYDIAGWTPAFSMGFRFERILNKFDGPFQQIPYGEIQIATGKFNKSASSAGYILDCRTNNSFIVVNNLLKSGAEVLRITKSSTGAVSIKQGSFFIPSNGKADAILEKAAKDLGLNIEPVAKRPEGVTEKLSAGRVALWDQYGGSMSSGWTRWILEQNKFPFSLIYSKEIDGGKLREKYDVIIFVSGAIPPLVQDNRSAFRDAAPKEEDTPAEYKPQLGRITSATSIPALKKFLEAGGTIITIGTSANLAYHLKLPVKDALVEIANGKQQTLPPEKYFIPGSIMHVSVDSTNSVSWGMRSEADVFFDSSPVFNLAPDAISKGEVTPIAWFASDKTLRSGWAWGQEYLQDGVAAFVAKVGSGKLYAFGPEITFRAQTQGTYKFLFNPLYKSNK